MQNKCMYLRYRTKKGKIYCYCTKKGAVVEFSSCFGCVDKEYKKTAKTTLKTQNRTPIKKVSKTNKITKATSIPIDVKRIVWERDNHKCIFCHKEVDLFFANSHYIKRSHLGLGIEQNIFTACLDCHHKFDDTPLRKSMLPFAKGYLLSKYSDWDEDMLIYKKYIN